MIATLKHGQARWPSSLAKTPHVKLVLEVLASWVHVSKCQTATESEYLYRPLYSTGLAPPTTYPGTDKSYRNHGHRYSATYTAPRGLFVDKSSAGPIRLDVASSATPAVGAQAILTGSTRLRLVTCITALEHPSGHRIGVAREALESVGAQCWTEPTSPLASTIGSVHTRCRPRPRTARARTKTNNNNNNNDHINMAKLGPRTLVATATCKSRSQNGGRC